MRARQANAVDGRVGQSCGRVAIFSEHWQPCGPNKKIKKNNTLSVP